VGLSLAQKNTGWLSHARGSSPRKNDIWPFCQALRGVFANHDGTMRSEPLPTGPQDHSRAAVVRLVASRCDPEVGFESIEPLQDAYLRTLRYKVIMNAKRAIAAAELIFVFPAALFFIALFVRNLQPLQYEPAHTAQRIVDWYAVRPRIGLWGLLIALPFGVLVAGCGTLLRNWSDDIELRKATRQTLAAIRVHLATLLVAGATLTAGGILAIRRSACIDGLTDFLSPSFIRLANVSPLRESRFENPRFETARDKSTRRRIHFNLNVHCGS